MAAFYLSHSIYCLFVGMMLVFLRAVPCPPTGRAASSQRPVDRRQRRVAAGQNQPGRHGDATQVHVNRRQQTWDDPAHRGQTSGQKKRGKEEGGGQGGRHQLLSLVWRLWMNV